MANLPETDLSAMIGRLQDSGVNIYGAGKIGERLIEAFRHYNIEIKQLWDVKAAEIGELSGIKVSLPPTAENAEHLETTTFVSIFAPLIAEEVKTKLADMGFAAIYTDRRLINDMMAEHCLDLDRQGAFEYDFNKCILCPLQKDDYQTCSLYDRHVVGHEVEAQDDAPLVIRSIGLLITSKCNLTCVGCNHLRDHYEKQHNVELPSEVVLADLSRFLQSVDHLKTLVLVGGESFSHRHVEKIIAGVLAEPKIGMLQIITNGTVVPKPAALALLADERVFIEVSGYGSNVGAHLVKKREVFFDRMAEYGINYRYAEFYKWTDFGGFEKRGYSEEEIRDTYLKCCFVSNDIFNGELHKCSRSAYGKFIGHIPDYPEDYVDLRRGSKEQLRERLRHYFADEKPRVCNHCNGTNTATIEAGVQKKEKVLA
ncbi:MAG: hypothetical protein ISR50_01050 [Alphaproteobacteria bacterium]|nr:hypothetical protein [Alphaproteobacteria bacterium]